MPSDESDLLDDEFGELGSDYGSSCTYSFCAFSLCFDDSVGSVSVLGSEFFAPTGVKSKSGRLLEIFWFSNFWFFSKFPNQFYSYSLTLRLQRLQPLYFSKNMYCALQ